jgi:hypothetical protein
MGHLRAPVVLAGLCSVPVVPPPISASSRERAFHAGKLRFFGSLECLRERRTFARQLARAKRFLWVVYAKRPFTGPQQVLDYVDRYTHRVAISNNRLLAIENDQVRFQWKDYRNVDQIKWMILSSEEFIRRFLLHVLPDRFQRIRYYGFLANRNRQEKLAECRRLLGMQVPIQQSTESQQDTDYRDRYEELTGCSLRQCPKCRQGRMLIVQILPRLVRTSPIAIDSS